MSERFKKDHIDDLEYRFTHTWGLGYQWRETSKLDFSTFAGLGYLQEKYDSRVPNPDYTGPQTPNYIQVPRIASLVSGDSEPKWLKDVKRRNDLIVQTGYHFEWKPFTRIHYLSNFSYNPSVDDRGDYNITHDSEVRTLMVP